MPDPTWVEVQAELDPQGFGRLIKIEKQYTSGTTNLFYCLGGTGLAGRARYCSTTKTDSAATQASAITTQMQA